MTATIGLVLDCTDPTELARFWSQALGYTTVGGAGNYVMLVDPLSLVQRCRCGALVIVQ